MGRINPDASRDGRPDLCCSWWGVFGGFGAYGIQNCRLRLETLGDRLRLEALGDRLRLGALSLACLQLVESLSRFLNEVECLPTVEFPFTWNA